MSTLKNLIVLADSDGYGPGSITYKVVEPSVFAWLDAPVDFENCSGYEEQVPAAAIADVRAQTPDLAIPLAVYVTSGSYRNDRALAAPGRTFTRVVDLVSYLRQEGVAIVLADEYVGAMY